MLLVVVVFLVVMVEGSGSTKQNLNYHHQPEDNIVYKQTCHNIGLYQFYLVLHYSSQQQKYNHCHQHGGGVVDKGVFFGGGNRVALGRIDTN